MFFNRWLCKDSVLQYEFGYIHVDLLVRDCPMKAYVRDNLCKSFLIFILISGQVLTEFI